MSILVIATLDTKGTEAAFVKTQLQAAGQSVLLLDASCLGTPLTGADITREEVFLAAGTTLAEQQARADRGAAVTAAAEGARACTLRLQSTGQLTGVLALGGSAGTTIGATAMQALPIGLPKLIVSTLASGQVRQWVGDKDILMMNSVVDIAGLNRLSTAILANAAAAMAGMVNARNNASKQLAPSAVRPLIAATMFGVTTPCVQQARRVLEEAGYEVLIFHATGNGGQAMESLIADGWFAGVLDITTTELADELVGGILSAGPNRLTAAAQAGIPQVVSVGALDMVNFGPPETVPVKFAVRSFYHHNAAVTLMRTTAAECRALGEEIGRKVSASKGPAAVLLPLAGVSAIDKSGQPFADVEARQALFAGIRATLAGPELIELDAHINDAEFAEAAARKLLSLLGIAARR